MLLFPLENSLDCICRENYRKQEEKNESVRESEGEKKTIKKAKKWEREREEGTR